MTTTRLLMLLILLAPAACSGGGTPVTAVNGTLLGKALVPADAFSSPLAAWPFVRITSYAGACGLEAAGATKASSSNLLFAFLTSPIFPGKQTSSFALSAPADVDVHFATYDAMCNTAGSLDNGATGTVTLSKGDATGIDGTFDLVMGGSGDHITGSFSAPACALPLPDAGAPDGGAGCL